MVVLVSAGHAEPYFETSPAFEDPVSLLPDDLEGFSAERGDLIAVY